MTETKFTKGTWIAARKHSSKVGLPIVASPHGRSIAAVTFFGLGEQFKSHDDESYANAHLIAAAPDLYSALSALLNRYVGLVHSGDAGFWDPEAEEEVINSRDALAKARGEA
ncbi:hypothetical protein [Brucella intermedia]|uniref:hypothetical protein n=1 Tax=Brucella intermedia TaxID=94625 RepID=UPI00158A30AB|nr:hypothetical protein [Brucella intermedia]